MSRQQRGGLCYVLYGYCHPYRAGLGSGFMTYCLLESTGVLKEMLRRVGNFIKARYKIA